MAQLTILFWRDIPSQVIVKAGRANEKRLLPAAFQEAIDMAAMRSGAAATDDYLEEWRREGPREVSDDLAREAEQAESDLCERYDRTVHIETDAFYGWIRMGYVRPWLEGSDRQNRMVARAIARAATVYAQDLYAVFIDGVIGPHLLPIYVDELAAAGAPVHLAILMPPLEATLARVRQREPTANVPEGPHRRLYQQFKRYRAFAGCTFDNGDLTPDQAGDRIMEACGRGDCIVYSPVS